MTKRTHRTEILIETHEITIIRFGKIKPIENSRDVVDVLAYDDPISKTNTEEEEEKENENETQS